MRVDRRGLFVGRRRLAACLLWLCSAGLAHGQSLLTRPLVLNTGGGRLHGSLMIPQGRGTPPLALIIAGSGPTDRDGNNPEGGHNDALLRLARGLARQGIASLRYDKRGVAASLAAGAREESLSVEGYARDAASWAAKLRQDPGFSQIVLVGHSEGALVASLAAPQCHPDGLVLIEGAGRPLDQILRQQLRGRLPPELLAHSHSILQTLKSGRLHAQVDPALMPLFRPSVQPYLISLLRQDPARAFASTRAPALILQGDRDAQVGLRDARLLHQARPDASLLIIKNMNHVLRYTAYPDLRRQLPSYNDPEQPIAAELVNALAAFINQDARYRR